TSSTYTVGLDKSAQITIAEPINTSSGGDRVSVTRHFRDLGRQDPIEGGNSLAFYIYRENTTTNKQSLTVNFSLGGTATPGGDYTGIIRRASDNVQIGTFTPVASGNSVTLAADVNGIVVELQPIDDNLAEGTETISLQLTGVSGSQAFYPLGVNRSVDVYLLDNDASTIQVGFASNSSLIGEQLDPASNVRQITVNLNRPSSQEISVRYRPTGGSAELGSDWTFLDSNVNPVNEGVLTFAPGETTKTITVRVQSDRIPENQESFGIVLERPTGASLKSGYNTHFVTVYDVIPEGIFKEERWSGGSVFTNNSWDSWVLVDSGYPGTEGSLKTTDIRVADIDPVKLTLWLNGGSIANKDQLGRVRLDTVQRSSGTLSFWVEGSQEPKAVKLQLEDTATGILVKTIEAKTIETIRSTGSGNSQATFAKSGSGINGVGQTFSTGTLGTNDRLTSISIVGPTSEATSDSFTLKVWENNDNFNTFAPGTLVATSTNSTSIPNNGQAVFNFSGPQLNPNKVYLFSLTDANGNDHAGFRSRITNVSGNRLEDGRLFSNLTDSTADLAFNLTLSPPPGGVGTVNWENATSLAVATNSTATGVGVSSLSVLPHDASTAMLNEINLPVSYVGYLNGLTPAQNVGSDFSRRLTGWITAAATGAYEFYLAADDDARLFVGTGEAPSSKVMVASQSGAVSFQQWTAKSSQKSVPINLVQGQRYYIEVQHREASGGDHLSVAWTGPGISTITPIVGPSVLPSADNRYIRFLDETTTLVEGQSGQILVALDRANLSASTTVGIEVVSGSTASQGTDFTLGTTTLTFAPGELTKSINISALTDSVNEGTEKVTLRLIAANGAQIINPNTHQLNITDVNAPAITGITGFSQRTDAVNTLIGQFSATPVQGRTMQNWEIIGGNP
ncbi:MAG: Calx-beta domain-containing protein, partial [Microcystis panniformis]